jgi:hypothetical protein
MAGALMQSSLANSRNVFPSTYTFTCGGKNIARNTVFKEMFELFFLS